MKEYLFPFESSALLASLTIRRPLSSGFDAHTRDNSVSPRLSKTPPSVRNSGKLKNLRSVFKRFPVMAIGGNNGGNADEAATAKERGSEGILMELSSFSPSTEIKPALVNLQRWPVVRLVASMCSAG
jgi:hypothetical protein